MVTSQHFQNKEQPFIIELKKIIKDPERINLHKEIVRWRKVAATKRSIMQNPPRDGTIITQVPLPPELLPFIKTNEHHVDQGVMNRIISGAIIPSKDRILSISQNYGMHPDHTATKDFIELGNQYITWCESYTPPEKQKPQTAVEKIKSGTENKIHSALKTQILKLLETRTELPGAKIVAIDAPEALKQPKEPKPISFAKVMNIANVDKVSTERVLKDESKLNEGQYNRYILPILKALSATPEETITVTDAFLEQQERNDPKKQPQQTKKTGSITR